MPTFHRRLIAATCAVVLLVPAAPAVGADAPPSELWEEYPLQEEPRAPGGEPAPQGGSAPRAEERTAPRPAGEDDDGGVPVAALAGGAVLLAALGAGALLAGRARRGGRPASPAAHRAAAPGPPAPAAGAAGAAQRVVLGYLRANAEEALLDDAAAVREAAARRGFTLRHVVWDRADDPARPWLSWVVGRIAAGEAEGVVLAHLADLGATPAERTLVLERLQGVGAAVVALDDGLDTSAERFARQADAAAPAPLPKEIAT